jgi:hypothetical protein
MAANAADQITEAIAAGGAAEEHRQVTVTLSSTSRHVVISFPVDITDSELLEFTGWVGSSLRLGLAQDRVASRLIVPTSIHRQQ